MPAHRLDDLESRLSNYLPSSKMVTGLNIHCDAACNGDRDEVVRQKQSRSRLPGRRAIEHSGSRNDCCSRRSAQTRYRISARWKRDLPPISPRLQRTKTGRMGRRRSRLRSGGSSQIQACLCVVIHDQWRQQTPLLCRVAFKPRDGSHRSRQSRRNRHSQIGKQKQLDRARYPSLALFPAPTHKPFQLR